MAAHRSRPVQLLDAWLYRYPFEGASARRYADRERCGFGDLDDRLLAQWAPELRQARRVVDVGAGPGVTVRRMAALYPHLDLVAVEPSDHYNRAAIPGATRLRARAETLPLADDSVDLACMVSSIRHVGDRRAALGELRRIVRHGGVAYVVELDPTSERRRWRNHTRGMRSLLSRVAFAPLVLWTAPTADDVADLARATGWTDIQRTDDPKQPVYTLRLT